MGDSVDEPPKVLRQTAAWLGGIAAVLVAAVGVKEGFERLFPASPKTSPEASSGAPPAAASPAAPGAATTPSPAPVASAPPTQAVPEAPAPVAGPVDLNGEWRDDDGGRFNFEQKGSKYELTHTAINGTFQMFGRGSVTGRDLSHTFEMATGETGSCTARINAAANKITGSCLMTDGGWTFVLDR